MMSLLSMAIFSVKLAGMSMPYEPNSTGVLDVADEVLDTIEPVTQARYDMWIEQGLDSEEAAQLALDSVNNDLLHHGELRGIEVKLINVEFNQTSNGISISIFCIRFKSFIIYFSLCIIRSINKLAGCSHAI